MMVLLWVDIGFFSSYCVKKEYVHSSIVMGIYSFFLWLLCKKECAHSNIVMGIYRSF